MLFENTMSQPWAEGEARLLWFEKEFEGPLHLLSKHTTPFIFIHLKFHMNVLFRNDCILH